MEEIVDERRACNRIQYLRHLRDFFGITFKIKPDPATKTVFLSCLGTGFKNLSKKVT